MQSIDQDIANLKTFAYREGLSSPATPPFSEKLRPQDAPLNGNANQPHTHPNTCHVICDSNFSIGSIGRAKD
jgi:hypothetical protein